MGNGRTGGPGAGVATIGNIGRSSRGVKQGVGLVKARLGWKYISMLVQARLDGRLRLIRQHDHALLAGQLAMNWIGLEREPDPLPFHLVLAAALHDASWRELDHRPIVDDESGRPHSFYTQPAASKFSAYRHGLDRLESLSRHCALLASMHYTSFVDAAEAPEFVRDETERQTRLARELDYGEEDEDQLSGELAYLRLFDNLSIFLCLTPPGSDDRQRPDWIDDLRHLKSPEGRLLHLTWLGEDLVHVDPFPFRDAVPLQLSYRELVKREFATQEELDEAWDDAPESSWNAWLRPAPRLA